ncbi:MAG TPA: DUF732 domain-containing protein [Candidatus Saccharimonadales bacterium]|nr:DUF732 domain-containing protein [Candidatus Saccharimonadales bacterium]
MKKLLVSAIVAALTLLAIGVARADSNDDDFVQAINHVGVGGAPADLITNARAVCSALDSGNPPDAARDALVSQLGVRADRAVRFVAISVTHYCPKYANLRFATGS